MTAMHDAYGIPKKISRGVDKKWAQNNSRNL